jgi:hypothetical protein
MMPIAQLIGRKKPRNLNASFRQQGVVSNKRYLCDLSVLKTSTSRTSRDKPGRPETATPGFATIRR